MANSILSTKLAPIAEAHDRFQLRRKQALVWLAAAIFGAIALFLQRQGQVLPTWSLPALIGFGVLGTLWLKLKARANRTDITTLARLVEQEHLDLHALLVTAVDQEPDRETGDFTYLQKRVIREALAKNLRDPWNQRGAERLFFTQAFHLLSFAAFVLIAVALGTSRPQRQLQAAIVFKGEIDVEPGNTSIERGSSVVVTATFGKKVPAEATLVLLPSDGATKKVPLKRNLADPVFGTSLMAVDANTKYHIEYGKSRSDDFQLTVFDYPALSQSDAELDYPDYTELPNRLIKDTRRITAVEGTDLSYSLLLNKPIEEGKLVGRDGTIVSLAADPDRANTYLANFPLTESNTYQLSLRDADGRTNKLTASFVIRVKQNQLATLKLTTPVGDQRFSPIEEVEFEGEIWDDYGMGAYGFAYAIGAEEPIEVEYGQKAEAKAKHAIKHLMEIEKFGVEPKSLISYYLWADDIGPDGKVRRNYSDMFFAEIRPFEEIFRENQAGDQQQQQQQQQQSQQGNNPAMQLAELQKEIINATWNIQRRESGREASEQFNDDVNVVIESQANALTQLEELGGELESEADKAKLQLAKDAMEKTMDQLSDAVAATDTSKLPGAIGTARAAYHYILQIQPEAFQVSQGGGGGGGGGGRSQQQLNQLEMTDEADRYETQSQAAGQQEEQQNEQLQIANRLKELARRQKDLNQRLQELQTALNEAETEEEREEIEQQLKRLRDQQREMVEDMDELRQRVANQETPEAAEALSQIDQVRQEAQQAAEALEDQQVSQALASGTRTQQDLEELRDDYRQQTSGQFSQAMQDLRSRANELAERQDQIKEDLESAANSDRQSLGASEEAERVMENASRQKEEIDSLMEDIRQISEESEESQPALSRQLYETYRGTDPTQLAEQFDYTSQLARLNLIDKAQEFEEQSHVAVDELKERIDRAAASVLGDGVESLRRARLALDELLEDVENEIASNLSDPNQGQSQSGGTPSENGQPGTSPREATENEEAQQLASTNQPGQQPGAGDQPGQQPRQGPSDQPGQQPGGGGQSGEGEEQTELAQQDQPAQGGQGEQPGQGGAGGDSQSPGDPNQEQPQQANRQQGEQPGQQPGGQGGQGDQGGGGNGGGGRQDSPRMAWNIGGNEGNPSGTDGAADGPLTGEDFSSFSDQLRAVEEMIDLPELQNEVASVRDRARAMRIDYKRNGKEPQWDLVQMEIEKPLAEIRQRVGEELARRLSREAVVPIDRDPVPQKYSELVRRYYETLGGGE